MSPPNRPTEDQRLIRLMVIAVIVIAFLVLTACSGVSGPGGLFTQNSPDAYAKIYCFNGRMAMDAGTPFIGGQALGEILSNGVLVYGDIPDEVILAVADIGCAGGIGDGTSPPIAAPLVP